MVSFQCESCGDTLKKPKLDSHAQRCRYAVFTCIDCNVTFQGTDYRAHTSCISEDQKYQKSLYKPKKGDKPIPKATPTPAPAAPAPIPTNGYTTSQTPAPSASNGVHPDRQRILDSSNKSIKRVREVEPVVAVVAVEVKEAVVEKVEEKVEEPAKKKSKKDKKEKKAAAAAAASEMIPATSTPAETTPTVTLPTFLASLLPTLLEKSISFAELRNSVLAKGTDAGFKEAEIGTALEEGIKMGGKKLKVVLSFE